MKTLVEYIKEAACNKDECESKSFSFTLNDLEGADEILKSLAEMEDVEVEDDKVTINAKKGEAAGEAFDKIKSFIEERSKDQKCASDEGYANKLHKLRDKIDEVTEFTTAPTEEEDAAAKGEKKDNKEEE